jgi:hypothetical protein
LALIRPIITISLAILIAAASPSLFAAEVTELASAFDEDDPFDFHFRVSYQYISRSGAIKRELAGYSAETVQTVKELQFDWTEQRIALRAEFGVWKDLQIHVELPIVLAQSRNLNFGQAADGDCGNPRETNCVTRNNSTLVRDGFFDGSQMSDGQISVASAGGPLGGYRLPDRAGLDQLHLGITWAPLSQKRDSTKPTWTLGFEARVAVGEGMEYDPLNPDGNTGVGRGLHQFQFSTAISRRYRYVDPWAKFYYLLPLATSTSLYERTHFPGTGQERSGPRHRGGVEMGLEIIPWDEPADNNKVSIAIQGKIETIFEGRGYSPMWEIFANNAKMVGPCSPTSTSTTTAIQPWDNGSYCQSVNDTIPFPGISRIENHLVFSTTVAFNLQLSRFFKAQVGATFSHEQEHLITNGDAGRDVNLDGLLDPESTAELNPMYRPMVDVTGRRLKVSESFNFRVAVSLMALF